MGYFLWTYLHKPLSLHCVFHSIRFKVNKVGIQRYPFFILNPSPHEEL